MAAFVRQEKLLQRRMSKFETTIQRITPVGARQESGVAQVFL